MLGVTRSLKVTSQGENPYITKVLLQPSSSILALSTSNNVIQIYENLLLVRELKGHSDAIFDFTFSKKDPNIIFSCSSDCTVKAWDIKSGKVLASRKVNGELFCCATDENGIVAVGVENGKYFFWEPASNTVLKELELHTNNVTQVSV